MTATVGVPCETCPGERRVALSPRACEVLIKAKLGVIVERSAGIASGFPDVEYEKRGVGLGTRQEVFETAQIVVQARTAGSNPEYGREDLGLLKSGQILIGFGDPLTSLRECVAQRSQWIAETDQNLPGFQKAEILSPVLRVRSGGPRLHHNLRRFENFLAGAEANAALLVFHVGKAGGNTGRALDNHAKLRFYQDFTGPRAEGHPAFARACLAGNSDSCCHSYPLKR